MNGSPSAGPVAGILAIKYTPRFVTIAGSVITCIGFAFSAYAQNVTILIITYGILGGERHVPMRQL